MSRVRAEKARALAAYGGSSARSSPYSLRVEPQPAALVDDGVVAAAQEGVDVTPGQFAGLLLHARVEVQGAATALARGNGHVAAVLLQHADGGLIEAREAHVGDAAREERHAMAARAFGGERAADLSEKERRLGGGRQLGQVAQPAQQPGGGQRAQQSLQPAGLVEIEHHAGQGKEGGRFQESVQQQPPAAFRQPAAARLRLDLLPRILHHAAVGHARGAGRFAAPARQAEPDVLDVGRGDRRPLGHAGHLVDAPPRGIHLQPQLAVGRAGVQAQAAVHAAVDIELPRSCNAMFRDGHRAGHGSRDWTDRTAL